MTTRLAVATVISRLIGLRGRAIVTAKSHHFVVDSPLSLGGPNEEVNPVDLLLSSLATSATFVCERAAQELKFPLQKATAVVIGEFDPRGSYGEPIDPHIQTLHLRLMAVGITAGQADMLANAIKARCPIYATLSRAVRVELEVTVEASNEASNGK